jgi:invasion protein IalB
MVGAEAVYRLASRFFCIPIAIGVAVACAALGDANGSEPIVSPWLKLCGDDLCQVSRGLGPSAKCLLVVTASVVERTGETKKTLRVILWRNVRFESGIRVSIDGEQAASRPYQNCFLNGIMFDCEAGPELVDQLKHSTTLVIDATSAAGVLDGFATAYDGPAIGALKVFEQKSGELQKELRERAEGKQRPKEQKKSSVTKSSGSSRLSMLPGSLNDSASMP